MPLNYDHHGIQDATFNLFSVNEKALIPNEIWWNIVAWHFIDEEPSFVYIVYITYAYVYMMR